MIEMSYNLQASFGPAPGSFHKIKKQLQKPADFLTRREMQGGCAGALKQTIIEAF